MSVRVIVVDDEQIARRRLVRLLTATEEATVVAECSGGHDAVRAIRELRPQLVFLDVQMPDIDGFEVLRELGPMQSTAVVFVTAFDEYAMKAFDAHAIDYLLKPFSTQRFNEAFARALAHVARSGTAEDEPRLSSLLRALSEWEAARPEKALFMERFAVRNDGALDIVRVADVDWWETSGNYVLAHVGTKRHQVRMSAKQLELRLDPRQFARIHRRFVVNLDRVAQVEPWFAGDSVIVLRDRTKLRLSRTFREAFHAKLLGLGSAPDDDAGDAPSTARR